MVSINVSFCCAKHAPPPPEQISLFPSPWPFAVWLGALGSRVGGAWCWWGTVIMPLSGGLSLCHLWEPVRLWLFSLNV